jgi:hypothetical protein
MTSLNWSFLGGTMARDYVAEIESLKTRSANNLWRTPYDVAELGKAWTTKEQSGVLRSDLFVIRLVTILEVATRAWIAALIDYGEPYVSRASDLFKKSGIKIGFSTAQAITGKRITLGELIAHTLNTNSIGDVDAALSALLDASPKQQLEGIKDLGWNALDQRSRWCPIRTRLIGCSNEFSSAGTSLCMSCLPHPLTTSQISKASFRTVSDSFPGWMF